MKWIAKNARIIYFIAVLGMLIKTMLPIEDVYNDAISVLFVLLVIPVCIIEYKWKKR